MSMPLGSMTTSARTSTTRSTTEARPRTGHRLGVTIAGRTSSPVGVGPWTTRTGIPVASRSGRADEDPWRLVVDDLEARVDRSTRIATYVGPAGRLDARRGRSWRWKLVGRWRGRPDRRRVVADVRHLRQVRGEDAPSPAGSSARSGRCPGSSWSSATRRGRRRASSRGRSRASLRGQLWTKRRRTRVTAGPVRVPAAARPRPAGSAARARSAAPDEARRVRQSRGARPPVAGSPAGRRPNGPRPSVGARSERIARASCGSLRLRTIRARSTRLTWPFSSETTTTTASVCSVMPEGRPMARPEPLGVDGRLGQRQQRARRRGSSRRG